MRLGVDLRGPVRQRGLGQPGLKLLCDYPPHHAVMDVQLGGNGADGPFFGMIITQDLGLDIRRRYPGGPR